ncbi:betaine--homocysteine S-methyltransferase 1-like [Tachypleus tridentatus]|uniref:betaine--homocysteine S-methyltransferase 1-like n=1 Tax=Tachypleus tridentatus TaxID=6853 RepID=UPI003FD464EC
MFQNQVSARSILWKKCRREISKISEEGRYFVVFKYWSLLKITREFLRAGSEVMQAFTFYASESNRKYRGNEAGENFSEDEINAN